jgi:hypothetical protein
MRFWNMNNKLKHYAAKASWYLYSSKTPPSYVIASTGRSGSTMMCHYIMSSLFKEYRSTSKALRLVFFPAFYDDEPNFSYIGGVYKTHSLGSDIPDNCLSIFIYDNPITTYDSFYKCVNKYGENWGRKHLKNLGSTWEGDLFDEENDILNYVNQLKSWEHKKNCLIIRFDKLWEYSEEIKVILNLNSDLPVKRERRAEFKKAKLQNSRYKYLYKTYTKFPEFKYSEF